MIPDDIEALALADSIGALDADERRELDALLAQLSPDEQAEVARLYDATSLVAGSVPLVDPPAHVRERVMAATRTPTRYTVWGSDADWAESGLPGLRIKVLAVDKARSLATLLIRAEPGAVYPSHKHHGPEECYVLRGSIVMEIAGEDSDHGEISTTEGADVLIVGAIEDYLPGH
jgi:anti-sigma factor ChrR (cupin superfamily)